MFPSATDKKRDNVEKAYPKILGKIREAIEKCSGQYVDIKFSDSEWDSCNYCEIEWYLRSYGYDCSYNSKYTTLGSFYKEYSVAVSWNIP